MRRWKREESEIESFSILFVEKDIKEGSEFLFNALVQSCACPSVLSWGEDSGPVTPAAKRYAGKWRISEGVRVRVR